MGYQRPIPTPTFDTLHLNPTYLPRSTQSHRHTIYHTCSLHYSLLSVSLKHIIFPTSTYLPTLIVFDLQNKQSQTHTRFYFHTIIVITKFVFSNA